MLAFIFYIKYILYKQEHVPHHLEMYHNCVLCRYHKEQDCTSLMNGGNTLKNIP